MNILLVDNTEIFRNILTQALLDYREFTLIFANTGLEALDLAESMDFQFVIVTQHLQDFDGVSLISKLRSSGKFLYRNVRKTPAFRPGMNSADTAGVPIRF